MKTTTINILFASTLTTMLQTEGREAIALAGSSVTELARHPDGLHVLIHSPAHGFAWVVENAMVDSNEHSER